MEAETRLRIDRFWDEVFGSGDEPDTAHVVEHGRGLEGYTGVYAVVRRQRTFVSAPAELVGVVRDWAPDAACAMDPAWWADRLHAWTVIGPSVHAFLDHSTSVPSPGPSRAVPLTEVVAALADRVSASEWTESGFAGADVEHAWLLCDEDGRPLAASNLTPFDGVAADVGVVVAADSRGQGHGAIVAAAAVAHAVARHGIARWRALTTNGSSRAIATRLGFEDDCLQIAVRPA